MKNIAHCAKNIFIEAAKLLYDDYVLYHKDTEETDMSSEASGRAPEPADKKGGVDINSKSTNSTQNNKNPGCCLGGK